MKMSPLIAMVVLLSGCFQAGPQAPQAQSGASVAAPQAPKVLTMARGGRPPSTIEGFSGEGGTGGGAGIIANIVHSHLTVPDPLAQDHAQLATELPSIERGTWQVHPDGRMTMTWKL